MYSTVAQLARLAVEEVRVSELLLHLPSNCNKAILNLSKYTPENLKWPLTLHFEVNSK